MDLLLRDLRHAFRGLWKNPALVVVATLSLGFGIAANVVVFTGVDFVILRPFTFPEQDRLIQVWTANPARGWREASVSLPDFFDWRNQSRTTTLAGYTRASFNLAGDDQPERVEGLAVAGDYFRIFGAQPVIGRLLSRNDETGSGGRVVVLSDRLWRDRFDRDRGVIGRSILLDDEPYTIIGVTPERFSVPRVRADLWTPLTEAGVDGTPPSRADHSYRVTGKLRPEATLDQARAELVAIAGRLEQAYPETNKGMTVNVLSYRDQIVEATTRQGAAITSVAVFFVLLIACANVANLLLARNAARSREIAIRSAVGAARPQIVRQLLTESLALALVGGVAGVALSLVGLRWFRSVLPSDVPGADQISLSVRSLAFSFAITGVAGIVFGMAPALRAAAPDLVGALRDGSRTGTPGLRKSRLRNGLVVTELALALILLISAGLLIKASLRLERTELGFDPSGVTTFRTALTPKEYDDSTKVVAFHDALIERLEAIPGVTRAGAVSELPMSSGTGTYYTIVGEPEPEEGKWPVAQFRLITPHYLEAVRIEVRQGRGLEPGDRLGATPVTLINQRFARAHWPDGSAVGRQIRFRSGLVRQIVGVVEDAREFGPDDPVPEVIYTPAAQTSPRRLAYAVRSDQTLDQLAPAIRQAVAELSPRQPIYDLGSFEQQIERELQSEVIMSRLLGVFGSIALLLAMMGVYGVMAYSVAQRTQELGVRRALGAGQLDILRLIGGQTGRLTALGVAIGVGLALLSTRALSAYLFGVSAFDPAVFVGVPLALVLASAAASLIPARRATAVDPLVALKSE